MKWVDIEPSGTAREKVSASTLFVQFADGSTWGDCEEATAALKVRRGTEKKLLDLESVYRRDGEVALINELLQPTDLPAIRLLQDFCQRTNDKSKVVDRLLSLRETSDDHGRLIKSIDGKP